MNEITRRQAIAGGLTAAGIAAMAASGVSSKDPEGWAHFNLPTDFDPNAINLEKMESAENSQKSTKTVPKKKMYSLGEIHINIDDISMVKRDYELDYCGNHTPSLSPIPPKATIHLKVNGERIHVKLSIQEVMDKIDKVWKAYSKMPAFITVERFMCL